MENTSREFLTVADVAARLGKSSRAVYRLIDKRALPSTKIGGVLFVPLVAWEAWVAEQNKTALAGVQGEK